MSRHNLLAAEQELADLRAAAEALCKRLGVALDRSDEACLSIPVEGAPGLCISMWQLSAAAGNPMVITRLPAAPPRNGRLDEIENRVVALEQSVESLHQRLAFAGEEVTLG